MTNILEHNRLKNYVDEFKRRPKGEKLVYFARLCNSSAQEVAKYFRWRLLARCFVQNGRITIVNRNFGIQAINCILDENENLELGERRFFLDHALAIENALDSQELECDIKTQYALFACINLIKYQHLGEETLINIIFRSALSYKFPYVGNEQLAISESVEYLSSFEG